MNFKITLSRYNNMHRLDRCVCPAENFPRKRIRQMPFAIFALKISRIHGIERARNFFMSGIRKTIGGIPQIRSLLKREPAAR